MTTPTQPALISYAPPSYLASFNNNQPTGYIPPVNTMDPRYKACAEHRVGCDCREAILAEELREWQLEYAAICRTAKKILAGHPTWIEVVDGRGYADLKPGCMCTGCQIVRDAYLKTQPGYFPTEGNTHV